VGRCEGTRRRRIPLHPWSDQDLIDAVHLGLTRDRARRETEKDLRAPKARFESLSAREREIMIRVVQGRLNEQIAGDIGIAEPTVKGPSQQSDAEDERTHSRRAWPNGGQTRAVVREGVSGGQHAVEFTSVVRARVDQLALNT
jgi:hypothetical protein